jgi:hypothetical protein
MRACCLHGNGALTVNGPRRLLPHGAQSVFLSVEKSLNSREICDNGSPSREFFSLIHNSRAEFLHIPRKR